MENLIKKAERGDAESQFQLGLAYCNGEGVDASYEKAFEWWMKAAEQELPGAQYNIGQMYLNGHGVDNDLAMAMYWFGKAYRQGMKEASKTMGDIKLWVVKEASDNCEMVTSSKYQEEIELFVKEKGKKIDRFIEDCKDRKKYQPDTYTENISDIAGMSLNLDIYPFPTSVRKKGFKTCLLVRLMNSRALHLWEDCANYECAYAYLDAVITMIRDLKEPWVSAMYMNYYHLKAHFYIQEQKWELAQQVLDSILTYRNICDLSQFAMDDEIIWAGMSEDEAQELFDNEYACYNAYLSMIECLLQQEKQEEASGYISELCNLITTRVERQDSSAIEAWMLEQFKNEANPGNGTNLIRLLKEYDITQLLAYCLPYCNIVEEQMEENGLGNGYKWTREQFELVEALFKSVIPFVENAKNYENQLPLLIWLRSCKGNYLMQTRRFVLAEKELMISLDLLNEALAKERGNVYVESLAQLIGILDNLYRLQNKKEEKQEFILLLTEGFQDDEKQNEYYLNLMKTILS